MELKAEILTAVRKLSRRIKRVRLKLNLLEDLKLNLSRELDGMPRSSEPANAVEKIAAEKVDAENLLHALKKIRWICRFELHAWLKKNLGAEHLYFELMTLNYRYVQEYQFHKIADALHYSLPSIYRFHRAGLAVLGIDTSIVEKIENQIA